MPRAQVPPTGARDFLWEADRSVRGYIKSFAGSWLSLYDLLEGMIHII
jgi:hypothetical protein